MKEHVRSILAEVKEQLAAKKQEIIAEINEYPPPIPACDQQFNFLLEERTRMTRLLREVDTFANQDATRLMRFIRSLSDFEEEQAERWEQGLGLYTVEVDA